MEFTIPIRNMKSYSMLLMLISLFSCQSDGNEELRRKLEAGIKKELEEKSTKRNEPLTTFEVRVFQYEEISENEADTLQRKNLATLINGLSFLDTVEIANNYSQYPAGIAQTMQKGDAYLSKSKDSLKKYRKQDSLIAEQIKGRKNNDKIYYNAHAYIKSQSGSNIALDTVNVLLKKDFKFYRFN